MDARRAVYSSEEDAVGLTTDLALAPTRVLEICGLLD
jgi:hypothetical protein